MKQIQHEVPIGDTNQASLREGERIRGIMATDTREKLNTINRVKRRQLRGRGFYFHEKVEVFSQES